MLQTSLVSHSIIFIVPKVALAAIIKTISVFIEKDNFSKLLKIKDFQNTQDIYKLLSPLNVLFFSEEGSCVYL